MLLIYIYRYLKRRTDKRPVYLKKIVDQSHHHGTRTEEPPVAIIIPTRDKVELLRACIESVIEKTSYKNFEIIVVDNLSAEQDTLEYLNDLTYRGVKVLKYPHKFNYSAICNMAGAATGADILCFLNNDTEVVSPGWLGYMIDHAQKSGVGLVGSVLTYPNGSIQHAGVALGYSGVAGHPFAQQPFEIIAKKPCFEVSAVTFACAVISKSKFLSAGALDESFRVGLNDVEFALRTREGGLVNLICTQSHLLHHESATRPSMKTARGAIRGFLEIRNILQLAGDKISKDEYFKNSE